MNLTQRSYKKELLDEDNIPFTAIKRNMHELNMINTLLGGHAITLKGFKQLLGNKKTITVCEIGCGGGDNLGAIAAWCKKKRITLHCIGIDIKEDCITVAKANKQLKNISHWITSDYSQVDFSEKPDIIFSSLFCHHFTEDELIFQLKWMHTNSTIGFFINDLHRHVLAYYSIKILTAVFSSSYLVKNDAPLSVARGFKTREWQHLLQHTPVTKYNIRWQWAFRYLITSQHA